MNFSTQQHKYYCGIDLHAKAMSHQDRLCPLVLNHQTLQQGLDWLPAPTVFTSLRGSKRVTREPRRLAAAAVV